MQPDALIALAVVALVAFVIGLLLSERRRA